MGLLVAVLQMYLVAIISIVAIPFAIIKGIIVIIFSKSLTLREKTYKISGLLFAGVLIAILLTGIFFIMVFLVETVADRAPDWLRPFIIIIVVSFWTAIWNWLIKTLGFR